jgi:hypothetical protein
MCKQQHRLKQTVAIEKSVPIKSTSLSYPEYPTGIAKSTSATSWIEPKKVRHLQAGDARFDETDLDVCSVLLSARLVAWEAVSFINHDESWGVTTFTAIGCVEAVVKIIKIF